MANIFSKLILIATLIFLTCSELSIVKVFAIDSKKQIIGTDNMPMLLISAGEFLMGSPDNIGDRDERPEHKIFLHDYYIDKYEVTNEQYVRFINSYGKDTDEQGNKMVYEHIWGIKMVSSSTWMVATQGYENHPVIYVSWYGANQYAKYYEKRLPTEAEWEKACRCASTTTWCFGDSESELSSYAWIMNSKTHPVGLKKPNLCGIYDMYGNVWEWCADGYGGRYYPESPSINPPGPTDVSKRIMRGGAWYCNSPTCRSSYRYWGIPSYWYGCTGFRCVMTPENKK